MENIQVLNVFMEGNLLDYAEYQILFSIFVGIYLVIGYS